MVNQMVVVSIFRWVLNLCWKEKMKNMQIWSTYSLFKGWLQITSIVVCRLNLVITVKVSSDTVPESYVYNGYRKFSEK